MRTRTIIAIILITIGILAFAYQGINFKTKENVMNLGSIEVTEEKTRTLPLSPVAGGIAMVGGIVLLITGRKKD